MPPVEPAPYLAGLRLHGRRVVVVGAGRVLARRLSTLLASGPQLVVVSPEATPRIQAAAAAGQLTWVPRPYREGDLDGAWYALACTDDVDVNARVVADAEARRLWCVRADDGALGSAVTPATARHAELHIAVLAGGDFRASRRLRDRLAALLPGLAATDEPTRRSTDPH